MSNLSRIASSTSSKIMMMIILIYLFFKTLVNPVFAMMDCFFANVLRNPGEIHLDWLSIIAHARTNEGYVYLPEARSDLLFELGLYFPEEK